MEEDKKEKNNNNNDNENDNNNNNNNNNEYLWSAQIHKSALGALHVKIPTYINRHIQENKINK